MLLNVGLGTLQVWVECNGTELEEYALKDVGNSKTKECHIASKEDQEFRIGVIAVERLQQSHRVDVYADGKWLAAKTMGTARSDDPMYIDGVWVTESQKKTFAFGRLMLKEDDGTAPMDSQMLNDLGTIRVQIEAVTTHPSTFRMPNQAVSLPSDNPVSEKAKKAGAHAARLGQLKTVATSTWSSSTSLPGYTPRDAIFRYAPIDMLYAREIIQRPLSPSSPPRASSSTTKSVQVKAEKGVGKVAGQKRKSDQAQIIDISSDEEDTASKRPKVKAEKKVKKERGAPLVRGEVIDLSD
ncbi:hypothetical protein DL93DRAFT_2166270 [Clavulina sp. PMI_390]|nr:hypothetical protein DL93DRAFT_2166270 [Clavulina sp. PMI_390]